MDVPGRLQQVDCRQVTGSSVLVSVCCVVFGGFVYVGKRLRFPTYIAARVRPFFPLRFPVMDADISSRYIFFIPHLPRFL